VEVRRHELDLGVGERYDQSDRPLRREGLPRPDERARGGRSGAVSWTDASGNFWLFGGTGLDALGASGSLDDLWRFDGTNWTWVSGSNTAGQRGVYGAKNVAGSSNVPGGRSGAVSWTDASGNFWLFGGTGLDALGASGSLDDLWRIPS
jgi:hypothetical protein